MEQQRGSLNDSYEWDENIQGFVRNNRQDGLIRPPHGAASQEPIQARQVPSPHGVSLQSAPGTNNCTRQDRDCRVQDGAST